MQQLRKSYSLSDLTASEDHSDGRSQQEIDEAAVAASDPRLVRRTVSVRGRSPRTYSAPKVDMDFPEMDVLVGHNARNIGRDMVKLRYDVSIILLFYTFCNVQNLFYPTVKLDLRKISVHRTYPKM